MTSDVPMWDDRTKGDDTLHRPGENDHDYGLRMLAEIRERHDARSLTPAPGSGTVSNRERPVTADTPQAQP